MHDSLTPLGGLVPMWLMQLGEVIFGGVGSGLYGMLAFAVVAVFIAGLMVGRTPEYLGKKIEAYEMKMASLAVLLPCALVVIGTAIAVMTPAGVAGVANPGAHGFSEILYAVSSASNNNGSAFGGLSANTPFWNVLLGICMFLARYPARHRDAGSGRFARGQAPRARIGRHLAYAYAAVRHAARLRGDRGRRTHLPAGAGPGADRRIPDVCRGTDP